MKVVGSYEAKTKFSQILRVVSRGEQFLITNHGKPVAKLVPVPESPGRDVVEIIEDLLTFHTRIDCSDVSLEEVRDAAMAGRR